MGILSFLNPFTAIAEVVAKPVTQYLNNRNEKVMASHKRQMRRIEGTQSWEDRQAEASNGSWKDEYLTILITIPFIMRFGATFIGKEAEAAVDRAISALSALPTEYWYLMSATFAAAFAIKGIPAAIQRIRATTKQG